MRASRASFGTKTLQILLICLLGLAHGADARRRRRLLQSRISAEFDTFYGIANNGSLYYWGVDPRNKDECRNQDRCTVSLAPTPFGAASQQWSQVGAGGSRNFGCGIPLNGGIPQCWGDPESDVVQAVNEVTEELTQLSVNSYHACGVSRTGSIVCWGGGAERNALGNGNNDSSIVRAVVDGTDWESVSCGQDFTFALKKEGSLFGWGSNVDHQVSPSNDTVILQPYQVPGTWISVSAGNFYTLAIDSTNTAYGWGRSEVLDFYFASGGSLGDGKPTCYNFETEEFCDVRVVEDTEEEDDDFDYAYEFYLKNEPEPVPVAGGLKFSSISAGGGLSCGIEQTTDKAYCWGYGTGEAFAEGSPQTNAPKLLDDSSWASILVGSSGTRCGTKTDGTLWCWGRNDFDCAEYCGLGDGTDNNSPVPVKVINVENWLPDTPPVPAPAPIPAPAPAPAPAPIFSPPEVSPENVPSPPPPMSSTIRRTSSMVAEVIMGMAVLTVLAVF